MALRLLISDAVWAEVEPVLRDLKHAAGSPPVLSDRMFIEAVLYQARTGTPWRDLPEEFGDWNAVYQRFRRWEQRTIWKRLGERIHRSQHKRLQALFIDSTIVRAHQHAAGPPKKRWPTRPGSGPLSGGPVHQAARSLPRRPHQRLVRVERRRAPRRGGVRAGVAGAAGDVRRGWGLR